MKKFLFSLGMLLLTVAAYADGTILFSTAKGSIDVPPYRIPGITCGHGGRLVASAARLVCGTDPGYGRVDESKLRRTSAVSSRRSAGRHDELSVYERDYRIRPRR